MTNYIVSDTDLTAVANKIRSKGGTSAQLEFPAEFISAIEAISGGGGGSAVVQALSVTQNGTYTPPSGVDGYAPVTVNVSGGGNVLLDDGTLDSIAELSSASNYVQSDVAACAMQLKKSTSSTGVVRVGDATIGNETVPCLRINPTSSSVSIGTIFLGKVPASAAKIIMECGDCTSSDWAVTALSELGFDSASNSVSPAQAVSDRPFGASVKPISNSMTVAQLVAQEHIAYEAEPTSKTALAAQRIEIDMSHVNVDSWLYMYFGSSTDVYLRKIWWE